MNLGEKLKSNILEKERICAEMVERRERERKEKEAIDLLQFSTRLSDIQMSIEKDINSGKTVLEYDFTHKLNIDTDITRLSQIPSGRNSDEKIELLDDFWSWLETQGLKLIIKVKFDDWYTEVKFKITSE